MILTKERPEILSGVETLLWTHIQWPGYVYLLHFDRRMGHNFLIVTDKMRLNGYYFREWKHESDMLPFLHTTFLPFYGDLVINNTRQRNNKILGE